MIYYSVELEETIRDYIEKAENFFTSFFSRRINLNQMDKRISTSDKGKIIQVRIIASVNIFKPAGLEEIPLRILRDNRIKTFQSH